MRVSGEATLHAPASRVYATLHDPAVLVATIPGCQRLEQIGADAYRMAVEAGVGAVRGVFSGEVSLTDQVAPERFVLRAAGAGTPGTVSASVTVTLTGVADGCTRLDYDAEAVVGGVIGGVGQRMLAAVAKRTAAEFFAAVDSALLTGLPAAESAAAAPVAATGAGGGPAAAPAAAPAVFTRPPAMAAGNRFLAGAVFGAVIALVGAVVGALLARGGRRSGGR